MMNMRRTSGLWWIGAVLVSWMAFSSSVFAQAKPVAVAHIMKVRGKVTITSAAGKTRAARMFRSVSAGETLTVPQGATVDLGFRKVGRLERITKPATVKISAEGCQPATAVEAVKLDDRRRKVFSSSIARVGKFGHRVGSVVTRGSSKQLPMVTPVIQSVVLAEVPSFSWSPAKGAVSYEVIVYSGASSKRRKWSTKTDKTRAAYAGKGRAGALRPGSTYRWEVIATLKDKTVKRILPAEGTGADEKLTFTVAPKALRQESREIKQLAASKNVTFMAMAGLWYMEKRAFDDAIVVNEQLVKIQPDTDLFHAYLSRLYELAGRGTDSKVARKKAETLGYVFETDSKKKKK